MSKNIENDKQSILDLFNNYLNIVGVKNIKELTLNQVKDILKISFDNFLDELVSIDEFSHICSKLFGIFTNNYDTKDDPELYSALLSGSELSFYIRKKEQLSDFKDFLTEIYTYRDKI